MATAVYSVVPTWVAGGSVMQNVLHYNIDESAGTTSQAYASALLNAFETTVVPKFLLAMSAAAQLASLRCKRVTAPGSITDIKAFPDGVHPGGIADDMGFAGECPILNFPFHTATRTVEGRIFIAGTPDTFISANFTQPDCDAKVGAIGAQLRTPLALVGVGGTATFCIYNRSTKIGHVPESHFVSFTIGVQKRRRQTID